jgi:electron transfer flavoprotein alpha subunit
MASGVMIFAEQREGKFRKIAFELLNIGKQLKDQVGGPLSAVVVGKGVEGLARDLGKFGAEKVYLVDGDLFANYSSEGYAAAVAAAAKKADPAILLTGASTMGKDLSPRVCAKLATGLSSDCTKLEVQAGKLIATRPVYSGKCYVKTQVPNTTPQMAAVRPNAYAAAAAGGGSAEVVKVDPGIGPDSLRAKVKEVVKSAAGKVDLTEANVIVSGGRGIKAAENFKILNELADVIGATVGASRAAVDSGYATQDMQVGQTGKVVNPNLYIACGISGAIQHLAGMRTSKVIVAVNKDSDAPIFQKADYGIVDDLFKVVPIMTEEFKKLLAE